jgi:hypothetical protein
MRLDETDVKPDFERNDLVPYIPPSTIYKDPIALTLIRNALLGRYGIGMVFTL